VSQRDRRREPYPWTWEPATAVGTTITAVLVVATQVGRAAANLAAGAGVALPPTAAGWLTSTPEILAGNAAAGLPPAAAADLTAPAGPGLLGWCIGVTGLLLVSAMVTVCTAGWRRWGPGGMRGAANPGEVRATLGLPRLRRSGRLIRPDLHEAGTGVEE